MAGGAASGFRRRRGRPAVARGGAACRAARRSQRTWRRSTEASGGGPPRTAAWQRWRRHERARKLVERARTRRARASAPHLGSIWALGRRKQWPDDGVRRRGGARWPWMAGGRRILDFRLSEGRSSGPTGWGGSYGGGEAMVSGDLKLVGRRPRIGPEDASCSSSFELCSRKKKEAGS